MITGLHVAAFSSVDDELARFIGDVLPAGPYRKIFIKPNWVKHEESEHFPAAALCTSTALLEIILRACVTKYPLAESITIGDVSLQSCEWEKLSAQLDLERLRRIARGSTKPSIHILDLRREVFVERKGYLARVSGEAQGDPLGYREVALDGSSFLDPISSDSSRFRVSDYDPQDTTSRHRQGVHRYLISGSALDADLFVNVPKLKTHQKAGMTGALKNLVGIVGEKAHLAHHRTGADEFAPDASALVRLQVRVREVLQKRSPAGFAIGRVVWNQLKRFAGINTEATKENLEKRMYIGAGSWYGNDTIWRMVYDLNRIIRYAPRQGGALAGQPQRDYIAIMDAGIAGEGNGPLQPLPVPLGIVLASGDPFLIDAASCRLMGFDDRRIPQLSHRREFQDPVWGHFDEAVEIHWKGERRAGIASLPVLHDFAPPPGWRDHIERTRGAP